MLRMEVLTEVQSPHYSFRPCREVYIFAKMGACMTERQKTAKPPREEQAKRRDKIMASSFLTNRSAKEYAPSESTISTRRDISRLRA